MKQRECEIVRDLLSLYIEELTNDTTKAVIEGHMQECKGCQEIYQEKLLDYAEQKERESGRERKFWRRLKRYRYQLLGSLLGVLFTICLLVGGIGFAIKSSQSRNYVDVHTENIQDYGNFEDYTGMSLLALFPSGGQIEQTDAEILRYVYECEGIKLYPTCQIYLECQYTEQEYKREVERIKQTRNSETNMQVKYSEEAYPYPAVYAMKNKESCNEYVLFLEQERKIVYIYLQGVVDRRELLFEEKYLPFDYEQNGMSSEEVEIYSIYPIREEW